MAGPTFAAQPDDLVMPVSFICSITAPPSPYRLTNYNTTISLNN
ncbi:hypothetical protein DCCM_2876 [Desulfocucumis palustris]|uniref:Uncharacterized protein n=1 Tax=Desulfocucumis palustris TaxID=1898651 RepID=A0A2L2XHQ6_9FIRM|nr:hypothetical protein DCCM_2876 [Desulfocucumis palustris]